MNKSRKRLNANTSYKLENITNSTEEDNVFNGSSQRYSSDCDDRDRSYEFKIDATKNNSSSFSRKRKARKMIFEKRKISKRESSEESEDVLPELVVENINNKHIHNFPEYWEVQKNDPIPQWCIDALNESKCNVSEYFTLNETQ